VARGHQEGERCRSRLTYWLTVLAGALAAAKANGATGAEAELHRLRSDLLRRLPSPECTEVEGCFRSALAIARKQGTRGFELRAAVSLARLLSDRGRRDEARDVLAPVYGWFTEGFGAPKSQIDLITATPGRQNREMTPTSATEIGIPNVQYRWTNRAAISRLGSKDRHDGRRVFPIQRVPWRRSLSGRGINCVDCLVHPGVYDKQRDGSHWLRPAPAGFWAQEARRACAWPCSPVA
jgi:hypothetical protein